MERRLLLSAVANTTTPEETTWSVTLFAAEMANITYPLTLIPAAGAPEDLTGNAASADGIWYRVASSESSGRDQGEEPWVVLTQTAPVAGGQYLGSVPQSSLSPGDRSEGGAIQFDPATRTHAGLSAHSPSLNVQPSSNNLNVWQGSLTFFDTTSGDGQPQSSPMPLEGRVASEGGWIAMSFSAFDPQTDAPPIAGLVNVSAPQTMAPDDVDVRAKAPAEPAGLEASRAQSQAFELSDVVHPSLENRVDGDLVPDAAEQRLRAVDLVLEEERFDDVATESLALQPEMREVGETAKLVPRTASPTQTNRANNSDPTAIGVIWPGDPAFATPHDFDGERMVRDEHLVLLGLPIAERIDVGPPDLPPAVSGHLVRTIAEVVAATDLLARVESVLAYRTDEVSLAQELGLVLIIHQVHRVHNALLKDELRPLGRFNLRPLAAMA